MSSNRKEKEGRGEGTSPSDRSLKFLFTTCNIHCIQCKMSRRFGFGGNVWEKRATFAFSAWSPKNCTGVLRSFRRGSSGHLPQTHTCRVGRFLLPLQPPRAGSRSSGRRTVSARATVAPAGVTQPPGSPRAHRPLSELRFPEPHRGGGTQLDTGTTRMRSMIKT